MTPQGFGTLPEFISEYDMLHYFYKIAHTQSLLYRHGRGVIKRDQFAIGNGTRRAWPIATRRDELQPACIKGHGI